MNSVCSAVVQSFPLWYTFPMKSPRFDIPFAIFLIFALTLGIFAPSEVSGGDTWRDDTGIGLSISLAPIYQFDSHVGESEFSVTRFIVSIEKELVKTRRSMLGLGVTYRLADYSFSGPPSDIWSRPWGSVHSAGVGMNALFFSGSKWGAMVGGSLDWSLEEGADLSDSVTYGMMASASYSARFDRRIGLGLAFFEGIEDTSLFPFLAVSWKFTDRLTLANPLGVSPAGPAGLELRYELSKLWKAGIGGAYRSFRFRLNDEGISPKGIGNVEALPVWIRVSYLTGGKFTFNLYGGAVFEGRLTLEDTGGGTLDEESYDPSFLAAITLDVEL